MFSWPSSEAIRAIATLETSMVAARAAEREQRKRVIDESIRRAESRLVALMEQKVSEEDGWRLDEQIASEVRALFERNSPLAPASRGRRGRAGTVVRTSVRYALTLAQQKRRPAGGPAGRRLRDSLEGDVLAVITPARTAYWRPCLWPRRRPGRSYS